MAPVPASPDRPGSQPAGGQAVTLFLGAIAGERASIRFFEFFADAIGNPHTLPGYACAMADFPSWCDGQAVPSMPCL